MSRQPTQQKKASADRLRPMDEAPRQGTLVEVVPIRGQPFVAYFDQRRLGWADWSDLVPMIRPDSEISG